MTRPTHGMQIKTSNAKIRKNPLIFSSTHKKNCLKMHHAIMSARGLIFKNRLLSRKKLTLTQNIEILSVTYNNHLRKRVHG